jgi:multidrug efflux system membrane fusion protein
VLFTLPQANLAEVQQRQAASGGKGLAVQAWSQDGTRQLDEGTLSALSNLVDASSGSITLKGVFPNQEQTLWPGASVTVRLVLDIQHDGLTIPAVALDQGPAGPFVWVVAPDNTAHPAQIKVRQRIRGRVLVSSGLNAGEQVVTNGQYGLTSGAQVTVQQGQPQQTASGAPTPPLRTNQPGRLGISP